MLGQYWFPLLVQYSVLLGELLLLQVYFNTIRNLVALDPDKCRVKPFMYITNTTGIHVNELTKFAVRLGWQIFYAPKFSIYGVPFVKDMYLDAARRVPDCSYYAFSNGDILFTHGFVDTLQVVSEVIENIGLCSMHLSRRENRAYSYSLIMITG